MFKSRNWKLIVVALTIIILLAVPGYYWMKKTNKEHAERQRSQLSPLIMVPGSSATVNRFNELVDLLNENTPYKHSLLKVEISEDGTLTHSGSIKEEDNEPFIVIGFQNNHDGYSNIKKQAGWLDDAFYEITKTYKFNNFKAFGHSNGGLIWTYWLEHYYSDYSDEITIKRLMTLGSPYNFSEKSIKYKTQMMTDFIKYRKRLPKNMIVYSLSGGKNYESDGIVPESSVEAGKYIFQNQVKSYTTMTVTGAEAQHSSLPQNKQVVRIIQEYLLKQQVKPGPNNSQNSKHKEN
ncbi:alpha/beta hydrolase [Lactobacillus delbrueckii subsp. lactis]|uniref:alpha/beta hydrolase n=1 Tax=Lactobacillus delbrueckii TaxID=1584 RepID=UPI000E105339|nr:alpha/beta hydrolase [Lactobacillus delbrueckii]MBO1168884.1 alpha/beta hydrolase [Lactobacillus delbrueckii subsp. lactis]MBO1170633.1 alpha/beta hydrolase [Lactobacillus delbrueckii subsp. lactis]MBO1172367.1 alpha/beta hydrolase [Lactobacillus delbrueckii subsp. lactis]MBO1175737.1 alpha/beta hydrolase [Lactobacillus delbrueckii subsp. lactis]MBO1177507.1 alpha/beta hydrolase [Lactobacillus delbrueckii subsp. lactis]